MFIKKTYLASVLLTIYLTSSGAMAIEKKECMNSEFEKSISLRYANEDIDENSHPRLTKKELNDLLKRGQKVCVIHDRFADIAHSYSVFLYKKKKPSKYFLVFEGGFSGSDKFGIGPIDN